MGPGGPFEVAEEQVFGAHHQVFVRRFPHLRALFEDGTAGNADRPYLVDGDRTVTFAEAARLVANTAAALRDEHRIGRGVRVAIAAANRYEHVIVIWAVIVLGGAVVELNAWWTGAELEHGIRLTDPKLLIGDDVRLARLDHAVPELTRQPRRRQHLLVRGRRDAPDDAHRRGRPVRVLVHEWYDGEAEGGGADASQQHPLGAVHRAGTRRGHHADRVPRDRGAAALPRLRPQLRRRSRR